jgi:hypothetical protein
LGWRACGTGTFFFGDSPSQLESCEKFVSKWDSVSTKDRQMKVDEQEFDAEAAGD